MYPISTGILNKLFILNCLKQNFTKKLENSYLTSYLQKMNENVHVTAIINIFVQCNMIQEKTINWR